MQTWIFIGAVFVALWVMQFVMTHFQMKNYYSTISEMSRRGSGYLGVGVSKKRFGKGVVTVLVSDEHDIVVDAKKMSGVTVFSRFEQYSEVIGENLSSLLAFNTDPQTQQALSKAVEKIEVEKK
ncbi:transcriptional regulator GutM [Salinicoccus hispanicus]|uniref:Transcriptional regulator n=1 Tax=Salinicoccus hispanicus TaxID=157225 RepID=A0A6N8U759_9STAP|nr:transcriptional regulator GutM [Salinicoccus hispanicus]MXQ51479.1 hypothetical protein [Salinicoccus hispanicus]